MNRTILRTFLVLVLPIFLSLVMALPVAAIGPGDLDTTFDTDGKVTTDFAGGNDVAQGVAIQSDGKIVAVGVTHTSTTSPLGDFAVARYNADGSLDTSFDTDGRVTTSFGSTGRHQAWAVAIYKTGPHAGKIVAVGDTTAFGANRFALARYNTDGSLDTTFDTDGKVTTDFRTAPSDIYPAAQGLSVALQSDGKIVVAGSFFKFYSNGFDFALARYNADGSLDTSFGGTGKVITDIGGPWTSGSGDAATSVAIQSDGKIVAAGYANPLAAGNTDFAVARYNTDGSLDTSFGTGGKVTTDLGSSTYDVGRSMAIQSNGKLVVAGESGSYPYADFALARYNTDGSLDTTFDTDGKVTTNFGGWDLGQAVAIRSDGKIVVAGHTQSTSYALDFALARYNTNGSLDTSFDTDGKVTTDFGGGRDAGHSVAIQSDGKIVVAGSGGGDFAVARYGPAEVSNTPPLAAAGPDQTVEQTSLQGALVTLNGSGSTDDGNIQPLTYSWTWTGGSASGVSPTVTLPLGQTTVTLTVNDGQFSATDTVLVTVRDTTKPVLTVPANVTVEQATRAGTAVPLTATATDICDAAPVVTSNAPAIFPLGTTTVTFTATDASGNVSTASMTVTVVDTTKPVLTVPANVTVEQATRAGTVVPLTATATDICDAAPVVTSNAPAIFPLGTTTVTFTATDASGNVSTASMTVTVVDTTKPVVTLGTSVLTLWPPNHNMVNVGLALTVSDICDADPAVVLSVTQDEKVDEDTGEGNFSPDAKILRDATGKITGLELRAERKGNGDGRVYLITVTVTDDSGNVTTKYATVTVSQSQSKKDTDAVAAQAAAAVAAGVPLAYDSTAGPVIGPKQ